MTIQIKNTQRAVKIDTKRMRAVIQHILNHFDYADFDIGVWFTTEKTIHRYNREYRSKDKPTDILSFAFHENLKPSTRIKPRNDDEKNIGDLIIAPTYIQKNGYPLKEQLNDRLVELLVHGICHLLGYDHETDADFRVMQRKEKEILREIKENTSQ